MHTISEEKLYSHPTTIRGSTNTLQTLNSVDNKGESPNILSEIIIDWFQVTIFPKKDYKNLTKNVLYNDYIFNDKIIPILFYELFKINSCDIVKENSGFNGYDIRYSYKGIDIMLNSEREDMGINILLKGSGCRDYEDLNIGWDNLFKKLINFDINFNRIDIAIDTFDNKYFDLDLITKYLNNGLCNSKFKKIFYAGEKKIKDSTQLGYMIQFGSKSSDLEITFYDKYLERENQGYIINNEISFWIRTELRFRHDKAKQIFELMNINENYMTFIKSILYNYIDFKTSYSSDTNISRRKTIKWWADFLEDCEKIKLSARSSERRITKIHNWLLDITSKSQLMVYISNLYNINIDNISIDLVYELLIKGSEKITDKDMQIINDYRIVNKLPYITRTQLLDYIQSIKDNILI